MTDAELRSLLDFAADAVWRAGKITLEYFQTDVETETKPDLSPVTIADRRAEECIRNRIAARFPQHAILGEEYGQTQGAGDFQWIIDPIDGTQSFVRGVPLYGVLLGLEHRFEPVLGVVYCPALDEMVCAARGLGCTLNGRRAGVSGTSILSESLVVTSGVEYYKAGRRAAWDRLTAAAARHRTWGDCYGYVLVATGRADVALDPVMHVWDCAPLLPILHEAGGKFTDWKGNATTRGGDAVASNGLLHSAALSVLAGS